MIYILQSAIVSVQQLRQAGRELGESVRYVDKGVYHVPLTLIKHSLINMDNISMVRGRSFRTDWKVKPHEHDEKGCGWKVLATSSALQGEFTQTSRNIYWYYRAWNWIESEWNELYRHEVCCTQIYKSIKNYKIVLFLRKWNTVTTCYQVRHRTFVTVLCYIIWCVIGRWCKFVTRCHLSWQYCHR